MAFGVAMLSTSGLTAVYLGKLQRNGLWYAACLGLCLSFGSGAWRLLKSYQGARGKRRLPPGRVDVLPEPLIYHNSVYENDVADPLRGWSLHAQYQDPRDLSIEKDTIVFSTRGRTGDDWNYIFLEPSSHQWKDFSWHFRMKRNTSFREFAFNFRYQDFDNRYRYRFERDKIFFDKKARGEWTNNIASAPFPMIIGQWYDVRIDACATLFRCYASGKMLLENVDTELSNGSICIILWEDDSQTQIAAEVGAIKV